MTDFHETHTPDAAPARTPVTPPASPMAQAPATPPVSPVGQTSAAPPASPMAHALLYGYRHSFPWNCRPQKHFYPLQTQQAAFSFFLPFLSISFPL